MRAEHLEILQCPICRDERTLEESAAGLTCTHCNATWPVVKGIPDFAGPSVTRVYRTETLDNLIAGAYTGLLPLMSLTVWRCPPMRFVDWTNMTIGRGVGGRFLTLPVSTGSLIEHIWGDYLDGLPVVGVDLSWKMLERARKRFHRMGLDALLVRADPDNLPFSADTFRSILSINGLHGFDQRDESLEQMHRVLEDDGFLGGSTLIRGQGRAADWFHSHYERQGITPMLRSKEYVLNELESLDPAKVLYETYGAVLFFSVEKIAEAHRATG